MVQSLREAKNLIDQVIVVDSQPVFANAIKSMVSRSAPDLVLGDYRNIDTIPTSILRREPSKTLYFVDCATLGDDPVGAIARLISLGVKKIVAVVDRKDPTLSSACRDLGVSAVVPKWLTVNDLAGVVDDIVLGRKWFPKDIMRSHRSESTPTLASLTERQFRILALMAQGLLNKQIAFALGVKEATVKHHASIIFRKLGVCRRAHAVAVFLRENTAERGQDIKLIHAA